MIKFFMNLFNFGKKKDFMEVELDRENGVMKITTNRSLTPREIMDILRKELEE